MSDDREAVRLLESFAVTVRRMREAQAAYFKTRDKQALVDSKILEKSVDQQLKMILGEKPCPQQ